MSESSTSPAYTDLAINESTGTNDSNSTDWEYTCSEYTYYLVAAAKYPIAFIVIIILALLQSKGKCCCHGRSCPSNCIFPINLLDGYKDRLGHACIFGAMTVELIDVLLKGNTLSGTVAIMDFKELYFPPYPLVSPFIKVLTILFNVGLITTAFYPLFLCLSTDYRFAGAVMGIGCTLYRLAYGLWIVTQCQITSAYESLHPLIQYNTLIYNMPALICLTGLTAKFFYVAIICIRKRQLGLHLRSQPLAEKHHVLYVHRLLGPTPLPWHEEESHHDGFMKKIKNFFTYKSLPYFRFPTRMIATFAMLITATYQIALMVVFAIWTQIDDLQKAAESIGTFQDYIGPLIAFLAKDYLKHLEKWLRVASNIWVGITGITVLLAAVYIYRACICYRKHIFKIYRGERSMFPENWAHLASQNVMTNAVRYAGLQVAFFMWGFVIIQFVFFLVAFIITYILFIPALEFQYYEIIIFVAEVIIIPVILSIAIYQSQVIITRLAFLQPKLKEEDVAKPLAIHNRHAFHNVSLFYFFFNILLGVVTAVMRVLKGMVFGIFFIPRIDHCIMMPQYETLDAGFMCYLSVLTVVTTHDHPVARVFMKLLYEGATKRQTCKSEETALSKKSRKARSNWHVAYTLLNNPSVIHHRKNGGSLTATKHATGHHIEVAIRAKKEGSKTSVAFSHAIGCAAAPAMEMKSSQKWQELADKPPIYPFVPLPGSAC